MSEQSFQPSDIKPGAESPKNRIYLLSLLFIILGLPTATLAEQLQITETIGDHNSTSSVVNVVHPTNSTPQPTESTNLLSSPQLKESPDPSIAPIPQLAEITKPSQNPHPPKSKPATPQLAEIGNPTPTPKPSGISANPSESQILLLGLIVNGQVVVESIRVRGKEDGEKAVDFDSWLVPLDDLRKPLKIQTFDLPGGGIEVTAPTIKGRYRLQNFSTDKQLGTVISIADLKAITGSPVTFDILKYALDIKLPEERPVFKRPTITDNTTLTDGLPANPPQRITLSAIEQRINTNGGDNRDTTTNGELRAVGNIYDTSWYLRLNQPTLDKPDTWNIAEANIIRQQPKADLIIGSQVPFWRRRGGHGTYWGFTSITRQGFAPPSQNYGGDFLVTDRLQSRRVGRTITGQAAPGSIVRLVRGGSLDPIDEILVDNSGVFRFDNVIVSGSQEFFGQDYRVLIYPKGELLTNPQIIIPKFTTTPGQLPQGASAWVLTGGGNLISRNTFGDFDEYQGGALYRTGISESLTVGVGIAQDRGWLGIGEIFWQPNNIPLEVALFTAAGTNTDFIGRLNYRPTSDFYINANTDNTSTRVDARWRINSNFSALTNYDTLRGISVGGEYLTSSLNSSTFLRGTIDDQGRTKLFANQRLDRWQASLQSNEANLVGQLSYKLTDAPNSDSGHRLIAGYQVNQQSGAFGSNSLTSLTWQYRSPGRASDGSYAWQSDVGYSWTSFGSGFSAGAEMALIPGWRLRGNYRGVSETSNQADFSLSVVTTFQVDGGIRGTDSRIDELRNQGRVEITAFYDTNQNGIQDAGEQTYWDPLLVKINQSDLTYYRNKLEDNTSTLSLAPGSYRIDIDPAGYPPNYRSAMQPLRIEVVASGLVRVAIPLTPSYVVTGVLTDQKGQPIADSRIEIISTDNKFKTDSITNNSGLFYLEGLGSGSYTFKVGSYPVSPANLKISPTTKPLQEINLSIELPPEMPQPKEEKKTMNSGINKLLLFGDRHK
jgi:hypothetical protein